MLLKIYCKSALKAAKVFIRLVEPSPRLSSVVVRAFTVGHDKLEMFTVTKNNRHPTQPHRRMSQQVYFQVEIYYYCCLRTPKQLLTSSSSLDKISIVSWPIIDSRAFSCLRSIFRHKIYIIKLHNSDAALFHLHLMMLWGQSRVINFEGKVCGAVGVRKLCHNVKFLFTFWMLRSSGFQSTSDLNYNYSPR